MRYTEAKLTKIAEEMLADIEQDTVDWRDNFDASLQEPIMLPTKFPNHLCNGTMGIAVGMATNMAPHNLSEIIDASLLLIEKEGKKVDESQIEIIREEDKTVLIDAVGVLVDEDDNGEYTINEKLASYLSELKAQKIVVTNAPREKLEPLLTDYDFKLFTLENAPKKSDIKYFKALLAEYELVADHVVYFDHLQKNLDAADAAGIEATLIYKEFITTQKFVNEFLESQVTEEGTYSVSVDEIMEIIK